MHQDRYVVDSKFKHMGSKNTTLEFTGILMPFLTCPNLLRNQMVVIQVDNIGCVSAWQNGYCKEDNMASVLVRVLVLVSSLISCLVPVYHHPRESSWESKTAERPPRELSMTNQDRMLLKSLKKHLYLTHSNHG